MEFKIGDLIEEWSDFSEGMRDKPTGIIVGIAELIGTTVYHINFLNSNGSEPIPLYANEIRKVS